MYSITRIIEFDAAHRVRGDHNKCRLLHGHRYRLEFSFANNSLDSLDKVIDFDVIKKIMQSWIDDNWDHNLILCNNDNELGSYVTKVTGQKVYYLKGNPTAENMASHLFYTICPNLFKHFTTHCNRIRLYETPNCYAEIF